jgi:hypothetical protein
MVSIVILIIIGIIYIWKSKKYKFKCLKCGYEPVGIRKLIALLMDGSKKCPKCKTLLPFRYENNKE